MSNSFNLIDQPWLPVVGLDGHLAELSLYDTLLQAHTWRELGGESPLVTTALYRFLLAVLHRVFGPKDREAWCALWATGRWDPRLLDAYLDKWRNRFDLFAREHAFYQMDDPRVHPRWAGDLVHETRAADTLFNHRNEVEGISFSSSAAARYLVTMQTFGFAGTKGATMNFTDSPCTRHIIFMARGETLFRTLLLNMVRYPTRDDVMPHTEEDRPCWEADDPFMPKREVPLGYLDYLTWPNRRLKLHVSDHNPALITHVSMGPGLKMAPDVRNPFVAYQVDQKSGYRPVTWQEDRALWRDVTSILPCGHDRPPLQLEYLAALSDVLKAEGIRQVLTAGLGMCTESGRDKVYFYRAEYMPLGLKILTDLDSYTHLKSALAEAESVGESLELIGRNKTYGAVATLASFELCPFQEAKGGRKPDDGDVRNLVISWSAGHRYWANLELPFYALVSELEHGDPLNARIAWADTIRRTAFDVLETVISGLPDNTASFKAAVLAREQMASGIAKVLAATTEINHERSAAS